jgi:hypothetical protein
MDFNCCSSTVLSGEFINIMKIGGFKDESNNLYRKLMPFKRFKGGH